ncbi:MAG: signal peptidase II [Candidatus Gracilibacteria bacterium]|nr:signal peptidase II [Candidatus Gracilibacteria bacterium]
MFYVILISGIIIDLISKYFANIYLQNKVNIIGDYLYLQYILNPGIAFGIKIYPPLLKILTISLIILIFYYYRYEKKENNNKLLDISYGLVLAGAIGNGIERVFNSNVIDFIGVKYFSIFNLADGFISIGAILYLYLIYKNNK